MTEEMNEEEKNEETADDPERNGPLYLMRFGGDVTTKAPPTRRP